MLSEDELKELQNWLETEMYEHDKLGELVKVIRGASEAQSFDAKMHKELVHWAKQLEQKLMNHSEAKRSREASSVQHDWLSWCSEGSSLKVEPLSVSKALRDDVLENDESKRECVAWLVNDFERKIQSSRQTTIGVGTFELHDAVKIAPLLARVAKPMTAEKKGYRHVVLTHNGQKIQVNAKNMHTKLDRGDHVILVGLTTAAELVGKKAQVIGSYIGSTNPRVIGTHRTEKYLVRLKEGERKKDKIWVKPENIRKTKNGAGSEEANEFNTGDNVCIAGLMAEVDVIDRKNKHYQVMLMEGKRKTMEIIKGIQPENMRKIHGTPKVFVIGNTGVGKSTFINFLNEIPLKWNEKSGGIVVDQDFRRDQCYAEIGHGAQSQTHEPKLIRSSLAELPVVYVDNPGYLDSRGPIIRMVNKINTHKVRVQADAVNATRVVVLIDYRIIEADRSSHIRSLENRLRSFLGMESDQASHDGICIGISHMPEGDNEKEKEKVKNTLDAGQGIFSKLLDTLFVYNPLEPLGSDIIDIIDNLETVASLPNDYSVGLEWDEIQELGKILLDAAAKIESIFSKIETPYLAEEVAPPSPEKLLHEVGLLRKVNGIFRSTLCFWELNESHSRKLIRCLANLIADFYGWFSTNHDPSILKIIKELDEVCANYNDIPGATTFEACTTLKNGINLDVVKTSKAALESAKVELKQKME
eukprot:g607.t1